MRSASSASAAMSIPVMKMSTVLTANRPKCAIRS